jgi:hypothetical protein
MKKSLAVAVMTLALVAMSIPSHAHRYDRANDNPARLIGYIAHPVGLALEYAVMRPMHWLVSQPNLDVAFGHHAYVEDDGTYFEWAHANYEPSIAKERQAAKPAAAKEPVAQPAK